MVLFGSKNLISPWLSARRSDEFIRNGLGCVYETGLILALRKNDKYKTEKGKQLYYRKKSIFFSIVGGKKTNLFFDSMTGMREQKYTEHFECLLDVTH